MILAKSCSKICQESFKNLCVWLNFGDSVLELAAASLGLHRDLNRVWLVWFPHMYRPRLTTWVCDAKVLDKHRFNGMRAQTFGWRQPVLFWY
jgi:hypothetical protein